MRVSRTVAAEHRAAILAAAVRLMRERGPDAPSVAEITAAAGLTHGGFYGHFTSKQALIAEAVGVSLDAVADAWDSLTRSDAADPLGALVTGTLEGSPTGVAADLGLIAADMARGDDASRQMFTEKLEDLIEIVAGTMPEGTENPRREALGTLAAVIGALVLARAADDEAVRADILAAGKGLFGL